LNKIDLSIVVTFYKNVENAQSVINTINSFREKDSHTIEVILINDSADGSVLNYVDDINLIIRVVELKKNLGVTGARNNGYKLANGLYVLFFDSDDFLISGLLGSVMNFLKNEPDVCFFRCIGIKNKLVGKGTLNYYSSKSPNLFYGKGECIVCVRNIFDYPFISELRGNEHVGLLRLAARKNAHNFLWADFPIRIYTNNPDGLSSKINTSQRSYLMAKGHFYSAFYSILIGEFRWGFRFIAAGIFRFFKFVYAIFSTKRLG
jgi:glycosyltransferase involved in cell wall biosynthesis